MIYIIIAIILFFLWFVYEMWSAPVVKENEDGGYKIVKPAKTWRDLFKNSPNDDIYR